MECPRCGQIHKYCSGHRSDGQPCGKRARKGQRVCGNHGGSSPQALAAADRRRQALVVDQQIQAALAEAYGENVPQIDPADAMMQAVWWKHAEVTALRRVVAAIPFEDRQWGVVSEKTGGEDWGTTQQAGPNVWVKALHTAEDHLVRFAAAARAAGVEDRRIQLAESSGQLLASVVQSILGRLGLSTEQQELVSVVVPEEFRRVAELQATSTPSTEGGAA